MDQTNLSVPPVEPCADPFRISPDSYLYEIYTHLLAEGHGLHPWQLTRRAAWFAEAARLLSLVQDFHQRMAWAVLLAESFNGFNAPLGLLVNTLLNEAEAVRCARVGEGRG